MPNNLPETPKSKSELENQRYMTIADICEYAQLSRTYIFHLRTKDPSFPTVVKFGSRSLYPTRSIVDYFDQHDSHAEILWGL